jgi:hypothetical protein
LRIFKKLRGIKVKYSQFINLIDKHQTLHVRPLSLSNSCNASAIPSAFGSLLADVVGALEKNYQELSKNGLAIAVHGLQMTAIAVESRAPALLNRILIPTKPLNHFCCVLSYIPIRDEEGMKQTDWSNSESIIIDFTLGLVINQQEYLYEVFKSGKRGKIYSCLDPGKLSMAWCQIQKQRLH